MERADLIDHLVAQTGMAPDAAKKAVNAVLTGIRKGLKDDGEVKLLGFGSFSIVRRAARAGRNPRTGEVVRIAARKVPKFKPGKALKDVVT